jgi:hypothetical protein
MNELNRYKNWCEALLLENQDLKEKIDSLNYQLNEAKLYRPTFFRRVKNKIKRMLHIGG